MGRERTFKWRLAGAATCGLALIAVAAQAQSNGGWAQPSSGQGQYGDQAQPYGQGGSGGGGSSLVGTWVGQNGSSNGVDHYNPDGTFVTVLQLSNGTVERFWGVYQAQPTGAGQLHVDLSLRGILPTEICAQAPGFPVRCRPNQMPPQIHADVTFTSAYSFQVNGVTMSRQAGSPLLQMRVPNRLVLAVQAPVQPRMRQPVAPAMAGHYTPVGPGSVQNLRQDTQDQQYRICGVNDGTVVHNPDGAVRCVN